MQQPGDELSTLTEYMVTSGINKWQLGLVFGAVVFVVTALAWGTVSGTIQKVEEHDTQLTIIETQYAEIIRRLDRIERK